LVSKMKDNDSIYHVLHDLADFMKKARGMMREGAEEGPSAPAGPQAAAGPPDEAAVFAEAMKDVRKVEPRQKRVARPRKAGAGTGTAIPGLRQGDGPTMDDLLRESSPFNVVNLPEYMEGYVEGTSPLVLEKLRGGAFSVQKALDLHGFTSPQAFDAFHAFLEEAVQSGLRCVKVIHGRGLKSRRGPVLKERLKEWLVRAMHRKWIVAFASCGMSAGGPGATTILLRAHAQKKRLHIIA
jgi:DNA-nicking Smr family endonuclease